MLGKIGKTESIREFAKANYSSFIEINFVEEPKYKTIIEEGYAAVDIIKNISRIDPDKKFIPQDTLILFDELQEFRDSNILKVFSVRMDGLMLYALDRCWVFHIKESKVTVSDIK